MGEKDTARGIWPEESQEEWALGPPLTFERHDWLGCHSQDTRKPQSGYLSRDGAHVLSVHDISDGQFPEALTTETHTSKVMNMLMTRSYGPGPFRSSSFVAKFRDRFLGSDSQKVFYLLFKVLFVRTVFPKSEKYPMHHMRDDLSTALIHLNTARVDANIVKLYPFFLAEAVVSCFRTMFVGSVADFDDEWTVKLYQDLSEEMLGFRWHPITVSAFRKNHCSRNTKKLPNLQCKSLPSFTTNTLSPSLQLHSQKVQLQLPGNPAVPIFFKNPFNREAPLTSSASIALPDIDGQPLSCQSVKTHGIGQVQVEWAQVDESRSLSDARGIFTSSLQLLHDHAKLFPDLNARSVMGEMLEVKALARERERMEKRMLVPRRRKHDVRGS